MRLIVLFLTLLLPLTQDAAPKPKNKTLHVPLEYWNDYDRFTDETRIAVGPFALEDMSARLESGGDVRLMAATYFGGKELKAPIQDFYLLFISRSQEWEFLKQDTLYLLADGERFALLPAVWDRNVKVGTVRETLAFRVPRKDFEKLSAAKKVELRLGKYEAELTDKHVRAFKELLEAATPPGGSVR